MNVFIIAALTVDGLIAKRKSHPAVWTSKEDKKWFTSMTQKAGVCILGRTTFENIPSDHQPLKNRVNYVYTTKPELLPKHKDIRPTQSPPKALLKEIDQAGFDQVAICGGASVYSLFLDSGMVDKLYLTIEPVVFGSGVGLFNSPSDVKLKLVQVKNLSDQTLLLEYDVIQ